MADICGTIKIDMQKYGMSGEVVVREPRFSRRKEAENAVGRISGAERDGTLDLSKSKIADVNVIAILMYVESAPFKCTLATLEPFYAYCDKMDDIDRGSASRFWDELCEAVESIEAGEVSPLPGSAEENPTQSSD